MTLLATNLVTNPSFETNTTGWVDGGNATLGTSTAQAFVGASSLTATSVAAGSMGVWTPATAIAATAGTQYTLSAYVRSATAGRTANIILAFFDSAAALVGTLTTGTLSASTAAWSRASVTATAPTGTATVQARLEIVDTAAAAEVHYWDAVLLEASASLGDYFDGSTPTSGGITYRWTGTAHASTSIKRRAITLIDDMSPAPRATVLIESEDVSPSAVKLDVLQVSGGVERIVRSGQGLAAAGGVFVTDYEIPFGVQVTYQARQYDSAGGVVGLTPSRTVQLDVDASSVVIQDPFAPTSALRVEAEGGFAGQVGRTRDTALYRVGRETVALSRELSLVRDASLLLATRTVADADKLLAVLSASPLLVRSMPSAVRLPGLFYCAVSAVNEIPMDVQWGGSWVRWALSADEVSRPTIPVLQPAVTWQRYVNAFVTWQDMIDAYPTWLDAIRNPPAEA